MTLEYAKQEMIRRYKYLYENAYFILAPYMYEQSEEDYKNQVEENLKILGYLVINSFAIIAISYAVL